MCSLFVTSNANWNSPLIKQRTLSFLKKIDHSLMDKLNELTTDYCENVMEKNVNDHCNCHEEGSTSIYCDMNGKCECQEHYGGETCDERRCILELNGEVRRSIQLTDTNVDVPITVWGSLHCTLRIGHRRGRRLVSKQYIYHTVNRFPSFLSSIRSST